MIKRLLISLILVVISNSSHAQVNVSRDELPNTNSSDSTAVLNNVLRQNQNAINSIGGYFNSNGYLGPANGGTGTNISAFPNGSILVYNSNNVGIGTFSQGTSGQILSSNGIGAFPSFITSTWVPSNIQVFPTNGTYTWTKPAGVSQVYVKLWGGGGNGPQGSAKGGSGGGYSEGVIAVTTNATVIVGAGGASDTSNVNNGGTSSFAGTITIQATGGAGAGGTAGVGSNGSINLTGQVGNLGIGGSSPFGGSSTSGNTAASIPGGGGYSTAVVSTGGADGMVIVYY